MHSFGKVKLSEMVPEHQERKLHNGSKILSLNCSKYYWHQNQQTQQNDNDDNDFS